ncbi:DUF6053 domain-containing protein [Lysobacter enzymogenes]|uniref:DUF6053 domain-containing protein n=1 Tax=Lysobacter enzymogenes TaxID=69 RepID=UPI003D18E9BC
MPSAQVASSHRAEKRRGQSPSHTSRPDVGGTSVPMLSAQVAASHRAEKRRG